MGSTVLRRMKPAASLRLFLFVLSVVAIILSFTTIRFFDPTFACTNPAAARSEDLALWSSSSSSSKASTSESSSEQAPPPSPCGKNPQYNNNNINNTSYDYDYDYYEYLTVAECQQRQKELQEQIVAEAEIYQDMVQEARKRADRNEYGRQRPNQWKPQLDEQYRQIATMLAKAPPMTTTTWTNFSHNSFPDLSIMGFPKAGTSHLYKLLVSHTDAQPVFKRKEFCMDHGHFMDYTSSSSSRTTTIRQENHQQQHQRMNNETMQALHKKLFNYHKHVLRKRTIATPNTTTTTTTTIQQQHKQQQHKQQQKPSLLINACLQIDELPYHIAYAALPESSKFIILFRDPADWLWASWNFWVDKNLDLQKPIDHDWASLGIHYRSPELFHELILSQGNTKSAGMRFRKMREQTVHGPRKVLHLLSLSSSLLKVKKDENRSHRGRGRGGLLFIKSEDMKGGNTNVENFLDDLSQFTGLSKEGFDKDVAYYSRTNCNANKGSQTSCNATTTATATGSAYEISHHRPMLEATRKLIYIQFWEECKVWAEEFGIVYRDCLRAVPREP